MLIALAACSTREGDLGRPETNPFIEGFMNTGGKLRAHANGELVSGFNTTDEEQVMRNRAWVLIRPPHAQDWISVDLWTFISSVQNVSLHFLTETQSARLTPTIDRAFDPKRYYWAMRAEKYSSHHARYNRVINDIRSDRESLGLFVPAAEQVIEVDNQRIAAVARKPDLDPREMKNAYARVDENRRFLEWVWRSLKYRMAAYAYAIKKLEIETPSPLVVDANQELKLLNMEFQKQNGYLSAAGPLNAETKPRPSRYTRRQWAAEDPNLVK
ncbi:hypothetical protein [uncultured Cohaesibacter sp.]|uniref:hypothetical protein n=1 Tax=uncultured Cohaesibacter sp. TaxID=1002546 RepID=UPI002930F4E4